jgi:hypothetical protein
VATVLVARIEYILYYDFGSKSEAPVNLVCVDSLETNDDGKEPQLYGALPVTAMVPYRMSR